MKYFFTWFAILAIYPIYRIIFSGLVETDDEFYARLQKLDGGK